MGGSVEQPHSRGHKRYRRQQMSEINVTPLVDVMLVLLIIFMVAAPMLTSGVKVNLPDEQASPVASSEEPLTVSLDAKGDIYLSNTKVTLKELETRLLALGEDEAKDTPVYVRGDTRIDYGKMMEVIGTINRSGFGKVALLTTGRQSSKRR